MGRAYVWLGTDGVWGGVDVHDSDDELVRSWEDEVTTPRALADLLEQAGVDREQAESMSNDLVKRWKGSEAETGSASHGTSEGGDSHGP
jgi:hypothetical protein